jgi:hypothetical protein
MQGDREACPLLRLQRLERVFIASSCKTASSKRGRSRQPWESSAIMQYLAERAGDERLPPRDPIGLPPTAASTGIQSRRHSHRPFVMS